MAAKKRKAFVSSSEEKRRAAAKASSSPAEPRSTPAKGKGAHRLTDAEKIALRESGYTARDVPALEVTETPLGPVGTATVIQEDDLFEQRHGL